MKNIFKILFAVILGVTLASCERNDTLAVADLKTSPEIISSLSSTSYVINETNLANTFETIIFKKADYGVALQTDNQLELAVAGTSFAKPINLGIATSENFVKLTYTELNNALINLGLTPNTPVDVEVRVKSNIKTDGIVENYVYSKPISFTVTPFKANPDDLFKKINVPGAYAGAAGYANWSPANSPDLYSPKNDDVYKGFIYITSSSNPDDYQYKFTIKQDWANDKGDDNTFTGKLVQDGEVNCKVTTGGAYYVKVDWAANTYSTNLANFGMIGDATPTGWNSDTDFVYNPTTKTYVINSIALSNSGVFKFRANDAWDMKFQPGSADQTLVSGKEVQTFLSSEGTVSGDPSYKVAEAGNYKVELDLHNSGYYKLTLTKL
jgi:hypothetical protein